MVIMGLVLLIGLRIRNGFALGSSKIRKALGGQLKKKGSLFVIGVLNGLLPCGLVYLAIAGAVVSGGIAEGALFMVLFGVGTVPMMFALPLFFRAARPGVRGWLRKASPVVMLLFGVLLMLRGMDLDIPFISPELADNGTVESCCELPE